MSISLWKPPLTDSTSNIGQLTALCVMSCFSFWKAGHVSAIYKFKKSLKGWKSGVLLAVSSTLRKQVQIDQISHNSWIIVILLFALLLSFQKICRIFFSPGGLSMMLHTILKLWLAALTKRDVMLWALHHAWFWCHNLIACFIIAKSL